MSRLGKKPIPLPPGVTATLASGVLTVRGPKGEIARTFKDDIAIAVTNDKIALSPARETTHARVLWGTYAAHVRNMIQGVTEGFTKKLGIEGVGYRAEMKGTALGLVVGFSHRLSIPIPAGITTTVEKNVITVSGIDKDAVGQFAAVVRLTKPPEPYKGKGIHYEGEYVLRKQGKRAAA